MNSALMIIRLARLLAMLGLLCLPISPALAGWPKVEPPPHAELAPFAGDLNYNGLNMRAWVFTSSASAQQVLQFYRDRWADLEMVENRFGPWQQISYKKQRYFITVQVQDGGNGSHGRISIMELNENANTTRLASNVPMMSGSKVLNDINSSDAINKSRTVALINSYSLSSNVSFYQEHYTAQGWTLVQNNPVEEKAHLLLFKKSSEEITVMITHKTHETDVLINQVKRRGWLQ